MRARKLFCTSEFTIRFGQHAKNRNPVNSEITNTVLLFQAAPQQMPPPGAVFAAPMMEALCTLDQKFRA